MNLFGSRFLLFGVLVGLIFSVGYAGQPNTALNNTSTSHAVKWFTQDPSNKQQTQLRVDLFLSTTCPHCRAADKFFHQLETKKPWLLVHRYYINKDTLALDRLNNLVQAQKITVAQFAVPAIFFCNARWLGFESAKNTGKEIVKSLNYCRAQIIKTGQLSSVTINAVRQWNVSNWYEANIAGHTSWSVLIPSLAVLDALMPCSLFGILIIIAWLVFIPSWGARAALSGLFLFCIGLVHVVEQLHFSSFYQMVLGLRWVACGVGLALLALLVLYRKELTHWQSMRRAQLVLLSVVATLTVVGVYSYNQNCVPNFSLVFQQYLTAQHVSSQQQVLYVLIYQGVYLLTLAALLFLALLGSARWTKLQWFLQKVAGFILILSAVFLIVYPLVMVRG